MIKGIIFDCFGVLYGGSLETLFSRCPPSRHSELSDIHNQADYGFITGEAYAQGLAEILNMPYDDVTALLRQEHHRNNELVDFVRTLKNEGVYKVGLLSNVGSGTVEELFGDELGELFDTVVLSYQESLAKPNPEMFALAAERMGLSTGECVMIDDMESNCDGAEIAGMQSILHITNDTTRREIAKILKKCLT